MFGCVYRAGPLSNVIDCNRSASGCSQSQERLGHNLFLLTLDSSLTDLAVRQSLSGRQFDRGT